MRVGRVGARAAPGGWGQGPLAGSFPLCSQICMARRVGSIEDIAWRGHRLRLWCFGCARSRTLDEGKVLQLFADRGWSLDLDAARRRFPCRRCGSFVAVMILHARQPPPPAPPEPEPELSWAGEVWKCQDCGWKTREIGRAHV